LYLFSSDQMSVSSFREYLLIINYIYGGLEKPLADSVKIS